MLPRKTLLISALLTAFVLSTLGGVAMALRQSTATPVAVGTSAPTALSAQEAASLAATVFNQKDIYSVENASVNGTSAYKVVFSSGQVAFVGLDGQILSVTQIQPTVVAQNNTASVLSNQVFAQAPAPSYSDDDHEGGGDD
jgi:hypothetical protein